MLEKNAQEKIHDLLNYRFKDPNNLIRALTRRSAVVPGTSYMEHNEAWATLGDGMLRVIIEDYLLEMVTDLTKGNLSRVRDSMVNNAEQAGIAKRIGLSDFLILGKQEEKNRHSLKDKILADCLEAIIGAVFLDSERDYIVAKRIVIHLWRLTPLYNHSFIIALGQKNLKMVEYYLNCGADPNVHLSSHLYSDVNYDEVFFKIPGLEGEPDTCDYVTTPLCDVAALGDVKLARLLLKFGADVNDVSLLGHNPLYYAAHNNHVEMVRLLCREKTKYIENKTDGYTALHIAVHRGHIETLEVLFSESEPPLEQADMYGKTPLYIAVSQEKTAAVEFLLDEGAAVNKARCDRINRLLETPLHVAVSKGFVGIARLLLRNDANPNVVDQNKQTPLHRAVMRKDEIIIKLLLKFRANINALDNESQTPVDLATDDIKALLKTRPVTSNSQRFFKSSAAAQPIMFSRIDEAQAECPCVIL